MKVFFRKQILLATIVLATFSFSANATDGYFSTGYGTINKSLAGAGIAYYQASLINGNPAGLVWIGKKYHMGLSFFNPNRQFTVGGTSSGAPFSLEAGTVPSGSKYYIIPSIGTNFVLSDYSSLGVALYGNGGMSTAFPPGGFKDTNSEYTGVELVQMFSNISYSFRLNDQHSFGLTGVLSYQYFEADGLGAFSLFSSDPANISGTGRSNSFGYGIKVGYLGQLNDYISVGASYQSKIYMSEFKEYAGLIAEKGDFDVPANWTVGVAFQVNDELTLMADFKQIMYSGVKSISNDLRVVVDEDTGMKRPATNFGDANGPGFGWEDMSIFKFGFAYQQYRSSWTFRGGYSMGNSPVSMENVMMNILAPAITTNQASLGFTKDLEKKKRRGRGWRGYRGRKKTGEGKQLHLAFTYAFPNSVQGVNPFDTPQSVELKMNQMELEVGFSF